MKLVALRFSCLTPFVLRLSVACGGDDDDSADGDGAEPDDPNDCVSVDTDPASPGYDRWDDRPPESTVPYACEYAWPTT